MDRVVKEARSQGWRVEQTKGNHWRFYAPDGVHIVHGPGTPSVRRSIDNTIAELRKYGFVWKGH